MKKERFIAFFDAIMAIIMTIVVLEFVIPNGPDWPDLKPLWFQILAYALSFFGLGVMWINHHSVWYHVETLTRPILFVNLFMLFFSSMIPFLTVYVGRNLDQKVPQMLYGINIILIVLCNQISIELLAKNNKGVKDRIKILRMSAIMDESIRLIGVIIGITVFPQAVMISSFVSMIVLIFVFKLIKRKRGGVAIQNREENE